MLRCSEAPPIIVMHLWINSSSNFKQPPLATLMNNKSNNYHILYVECHGSNSNYRSTKNVSICNTCDRNSITIIYLNNVK